MAREIFISYSRWNLEQVKAIKTEIEQATGAECWMDLNAIESGAAQFTQDIVDGINTCPVFLFMLSKESQVSEFALREMNFAMLKTKKDKQKHVVIVNIDDCEMCDEFLFMYSLTDTIAWGNLPQKEKLLRDVRRWLGKGEDEAKRKAEAEEKRRTEEEGKRKAEEESKHKAEEEAKRKAAEEEEHQRMLKELENVELLPTKKYGKYGFVDKSGKVVIPCQWEYADSFSEGLAKVKDRNGKWGFIDKTGKVVIPCKWEDNSWFREGLAGVKDSNEKWGFIDKMGNLVIPCQWDKTWSFSEGLVSVKDANGKWGFIDKTGKVVIPCQWNDAWPFSEGLAKVKDANEKWGYIDKTGKVVIPCQWESAWSFSKGFADVIVNGERWKIDKSGKTLWTSAIPFSEGLARVQDSNGKYGFIDETGKVVVPCLWEIALSFSKGLADVKDSKGKWWHIDKTGKVVR